jgi:hypothetical protein
MEARRQNIKKAVATMRRTRRCAMAGLVVFALGSSRQQAGHG